MKNLLACLAILAAFCVAAQVNDFQLPYNPDAQPDGYIGAADVVELLTYYGQTFTPDGIATNEDSTVMVLDVGLKSYPQCLASCRQLQGSWRLANLSDMGVAIDQIASTGQFIYVSDNSLSLESSFSKTSGLFYYGPTEVVVSGLADNALGTQRRCFCATHERPRVEYTVLDPMESIYTDDASEFESWLNEKAQEGWKLMPTPAGYAEPGTWIQLWRWAD